MCAFSLLSEQRPDAELHVYGHDHGKGEAAQVWWIQSGLKGCVFFHGVVSHEDLLAAMAVANVFVHTALEESFGTVIAEAMACGAAVVAGRNSGAVPWVVDEGGVLTDVTQAEAVSQAVLSLLSNPQLAARLVTVARGRVRELFSADAVVSAYEQEYGAALVHQATALSQIVT
jgi:L-malate glycosyltransferase